MVHSPKFAAKFRELRKLIKDLSRFKGLRPIINVIQNLYLILRFIQDYRETNKYLLGQWGYGNKNYIPLESFHEICFPETKGMFVYNPTLLLDKGNLRFFVRVTNQSNIPNVNIFGQLKKRGARSGAVNGIAEFALDNNHNVINYREIIELSKVPNFEDPKAFSYRRNGITGRQAGVIWR